MGINHDFGTCLDCKARRKVRHHEWIRAARPRCYTCGGSLEPSAMASGEHVAHGDVKREQKERSQS